MESKTYFASSVPAALELARRELGPDAMLVGSRLAPQESRSFGRLEVTFAYERSARLAIGATNEALFPQNVPQHMPQNMPQNIRGNSDLGELRDELAALRSAIGSGGRGAIAFDPYERILSKLVQSGLGDDTAREIAQSAKAAGGSPETAVRNELFGRVSTQPFAEWKPGENRTLAMIGPAGRGKSSSLVKIAIRHGLAEGVPTRIYSAGVHPVGGAEQMARYAGILGVPFSWYETPEALHLALQGERWRGLVLIDMPAMGPLDHVEYAGWERVFRAYGGVERHLVLRADARSADVTGMVERYRPLGTTHLFFAGLDEGCNEAALVDGAIRSGLPLCFAGTGPKIPEDLMLVDASALIRSVWPERARAAAA